MGIGEVGGPALLFSIEIVNGTDQALQLDYVVVNTSYGPQATPAIPLFGDPHSSPFQGSVAPGGSARGVYVFRVSPEDRADVSVSVSHESLSPVVVFRGSAPR